MTVFTETWDATYETLPPDTGESASLGASRIRSVKQAIQERIEVDHSFAGDAHDGKHLKVTLKFRASKPTNDATDGALYSKEVSGVTELFYVDDTGAEVQLTSGGLAGGFPSGTKMVFQQTAAPTGWTKDTTHNNKAFRVVTGSVGSGGATAFTTIFGSGKTSGSTSPATNSRGAHTHSTTSVSNHNHTTIAAGSHTHSVSPDGWSTFGNPPSPTTSIISGSLVVGSGLIENTETLQSLRKSGGGAKTTSNTGSHTHTITSAGGHSHTANSAGAHTHTVNSHTHTLSLDLQYVDLIIATKD